MIVPPQKTHILIVQEKVKTKEGGTRKQRLQFEDSNYTAQLRENLSVVNSALSRSWYNIKIENEEMATLQAQLSSKENMEQGKDYTVDFSQRILYRVFNDTQFETGGRFYGGWWQNIPKKYRANIIIDGKLTVEFDYSTIHPTILYLQEGLKPPVDSYTCITDENFKGLNVDQNELRSILKVAFNAMLNSTKPIRNAPNDISPKQFGLKWSQVSNAVLETHSPISHHFYADAGRRLQKIDSDIAEIVLLHFAEIKIPILPIHDSFLMHHRFGEELTEIMRKAFKKKVGGDINIDQKLIQRLSSLPNTKHDDDNFQDIIELLSQGYMKRESRFSSLN